MQIEREAVEAARSGGDALEALIVRLWPEAYRIAFAIVRDRGMAEDAAQEACATIAHRLNSLKSSDAFAAWSYRVMTSRALDAVRSRRPLTSLDEVRRVKAHVDSDDAFAISEALGLLEPRQRATILLHYYAGLNSAEIGAALAIAPVTVRFHLMRARAALRKALAIIDAPNPLEGVLVDVQ
jgi:RNA polymerase sigma-70 factor (ECF subfamily)